MAYQPKSYRKFLAGTITAAVVASAVAPAASAAEVKFTDLTGVSAETLTAIEALVGLNVIVGFPDGTFKPNQPINNSQAAEMIVKFLPNVDPKAAPTGKVFEDLTEKSYASKFAEALVDAGLIPAGGKFNATTGITREAMAVVAVKAFGLTDTGKAVEIKDLDKASEAARASIKILAQHNLTNLLEGNFRPTETVTRSQFALFFYRGVQAVEAAKAELKAEVKVVDVKKVEVKFNKAVDTATVKVELKQGSATRYTVAKWAEDKKSVVLEAPTALTEGDYNVSVTDGTKAPVLTAVKVLPETVTSVEVVTNELVDGSAAANVTFKVLNQYGTAMNVIGNNAEVTASAYNVTQGKVVTKVATANWGTKSEFGLKLDTTTDDVKVGDEIRVILTYKGVNVTKTLKVIATSSVAEVGFGAPVLPTNATRFQPGQNSVKVPVTLKDQYGKDIKLTPAMLGTDVTITSSNTTKASVNTTLAVDTDGNLLVDLKESGNVVFTIFAPASGKIATTTLAISDLPGPTTVTVSQPTTLVAAGEAVTLDVASFDQYGAKADFTGVTFSYKIGTGAATTVTPTDGKVTFTPATAGDVTFTAVDATKELAKVTFKVEAAAVPTNITSVTAPTLFEKGASNTVLATDLSFKDQYGRAYALKQTDNVTVAYKDTTEGATREVGFVVNDVVNTTGTDVAGQLDGNDTITFTGNGVATVAAGTEAITLTINNAPYELALSSIATADVKSYALTAVPTVYAVKGTNFGVDHAATLELVGKTADGKEVVLLNDKVDNVTSTNLTVATVDLTANVAKVLGQKEGTSAVAVWSKGVKLAETTVTVSEVAPVASAVKFTKSSYTVASGTNTQVLADQLSVKDQYGVAKTDVGFYASSDSSIATVNATTGLVTRVAGKTGTVTITYITTNGLFATTTVKFN
jgi:trimeric autotransporter adhesin